ncbi:hypothetical protein Tco_1545630, partial [Tanacetum coccineum]
MENLPPPNNDPNILEDEHAPAPDHDPIAPNPAPIQPNDYLANDEADPEEEEEPIPEQAPSALVGFAPQWIGGHNPNNNNGWIEEDDKDEVESEEEDEEEMEDEEDEELEVRLEAQWLRQWLENVATLGLEVANEKSWTEVKQMMIDEFNELALLCPDTVPNEKKKVELYIKGLPEIIKGEMTSSRPTMLNDAVLMAHTLMEQKIQAKNGRIAEGNKRRWENNNQGGNNNHNNNNNRSNNDNRNNNNRNNRGNYRDNNRHNHYNRRRQDGARAMTAAQNNVVGQGGPTP